MIAVTEKEKGLASFALFSQLYDEKKNIISVIIDFMKLSVIHHRTQIVSVAAIDSYLKADYGFEIPKTVIESSIRMADFLKQDRANKTNYIIDYSKLNVEDVSCDEKIREVAKEVDNVVSSLRQALRAKEGEEIDKISDIDLKRALSTFLIEDGHTSDLSQQIEQFVILNPALQPIFQKIIQGSIIFMGLSYNSKPTEFTVIDNDLVVYLDTELLFFMAGYNGETFHELFDEFYEVVSEINKRSYTKKGKSLIHLRFFPEIKEEIDNYFLTAETIVSHKKILDSSKNAMAYIVTHAQTPSEVVSMKASFWRLVNDKSIKEEEYKDYYEYKNKRFNIESSQLLDSVVGDEEDKGNNLRYLNYVNIRRAGNPQTEFKKMGYVFLTQTQIALQLSRTIRKDCGQNNVPLAFTLGELTTRLWLGLNQGFKQAETLKNFDVIIKAQIAFASRTTQSVENKYKDLIKRKDDYSDEEMASCIAALRLSVPMKPEEMTMENEDILQTNDLEMFIEDKMHEIRHKDTLIIEKDTEIKELRIYKELADSKQNENEKLRECIRKKNIELFKKETCDWQKGRHRFLTKNIKIRYVKSIIITFLLLACIVVAIVEFVMKIGLRGGVLFGIVLLFELVFDWGKRLNSIPGLKQSIAFLFCHKDRMKVEIQFSNRYKQKHKRPAFSWYDSVA